MPSSIRPHSPRWLAVFASALALALAGCGSAPKLLQPAAPDNAAAKPSGKPRAGELPVLPPAGSGRGGYYMDDGPGENPPAGLLDTPDAEPKVEPYLARANRPYNVFGKTYTPMVDERPFKQRGIGSWYGRKFHRQKTSSGELYDMYKMTAAHPTLPIPSYARVTNLANGKQVIVRINDRGPFHSNRIIDLSYTAALKLGYLSTGSSQLEVERLLPEDIARINARKQEQVAQVEQAMPAADLGVKDDASATAAAAAAAVAVAVPQGEPIEMLALAQTQTEPQPQPQATAVPVEPAPTAPVAPAGTAAAFYLQLGAFSQRANAEAARERLAPAAPSPLEVVEAGPLFRIYSGPFASRSDAAAAAQRMLESGAGKAMVVQR
ncbi:septal ring lytic transglycosylase RlpA family protein [Oxalobacteraceae bacterium OM1]|nr:septal ring lytic transglycosylase RlpA family protein [Oxalobacteraceae bacterium OM1]